MTVTSLLRTPGLARSRRRASFLTAAALAVVAVAVIAAVFGRLIFPDATHQDLLETLAPPGSDGHVLGTDSLGRDILQLTVAGAGSALLGPLVVECGSMLLAIVLGTLAGYKRGPIDFVLGRVSDLLFALPVVLVALVVGGIFGGGYWMLVAIFIVLFAPSDLRVVRAGVLEQTPRAYVEAAKLLGYSTWRILFRHILPNIRNLVVTEFLLSYAGAILALASLSYLGIGVSPGAADWGRQLADGREIMFSNPAAVVAPMVCVLLVACAVNVLGDAWEARAEREFRG
ncbi:ABC transporter permease [Gryllotalpicola protaetiae]|uniref:ABC transporter permease n=1 Tax=Gryllotalpicola protaetiae TaxID=2419771 RepID=A0A387BEF1_9MICO|nr:ABC transporter permease [Gryllotalpicola protaetiae]AYG02283.1 ABC transporter permease [Gryllotalpicola protaetiae]